LLAGVEFKALYIHFNRIAHWRHKHQLYVRRFFAILSPNWPLSLKQVLASPKKTSAHGGEPKTPRIWALLTNPKPFRTAF
jgi:hypothetical protein